MYKEFYGEPPFHHHHHMGPMEHEHIANAAAYARLNTKLSVHMNDDSRHITDEEREKWNEAADNAITDVDEILAEKADVEDIPTKLSDLEDDKGYITAAQLDSVIGTLDQRFLPYGQVENLLAGYAKEEQLVSYIRNTDTLFTYNGKSILKGDSIVVSSSSDQPQVVVDPYVLPVATSSTLGGIKVGSNNNTLGNNKYPVQLTTNNIAYVYVPTSGGGSAGSVTYEYIPTYSINILSSTMRRVGTPSQYKVEGRIEWQVVKNAETTSIVPKTNADGVRCEVWMSNTNIDSVRNANGSAVGPIGTNAATNTRYFELNDDNIVYIDNASTENLIDRLGEYVNIRLYKSEGNNESVVASVVVPIRMDGLDGAEGQQGPMQSLNFEVLRLRYWTSNPDPAYNNGSVVESGVRYQDIVSYDDAYGPWGYYRCTQPGTTARPVINAEGEVGAGWSPFTSMGDAAFDVLLANSAYINSLTSKQVVVTNNSEQPVAGMVSGTYIPTELGNANNPDGIRIFAGALDNTGNLATAPFTVNSTGHLKADDAELNGTLTIQGEDSGQIILTTGTYTPKMQNPKDFPLLRLVDSEDNNILTLGGAEGAVVWDAPNVVYEDGGGKISNGAVSWNSSGVATINASRVQFIIGGNRYTISVDQSGNVKATAV